MRARRVGGLRKQRRGGRPAARVAATAVPGCGPAVRAAGRRRKAAEPPEADAAPGLDAPPLRSREDTIKSSGVATYGGRWRAAGQASRRGALRRRLGHEKVRRQLPTAPPPAPPPPPPPPELSRRAGPSCADGGHGGGLQPVWLPPLTRRGARRRRRGRHAGHRAARPAAGAGGAAVAEGGEADDAGGAAPQEGEGCAACGVEGRAGGGRAERRASRAAPPQ